MGSDKYFGGLNVISIGDFHQLAPINKSWIFQQTRFHGRANNTTINIWEVLFKMYQLMEHVRSVNDKVYSKLQEYISVGIVTEDIKDNFNTKKLNQLPRDIIKLAANYMPSRRLEILPDLTNVK